MKKTLFMLYVVAAIISGCSKSASPSNNGNNNGNNNNNGNGSTEPTRTVIIQDNGVEHKAYEQWGTTMTYVNKIVFVLSSGTDHYGSHCGFYINDSSYDFKLDITGYYGPSNLVGKYTKNYANLAEEYTAKYASYKRWGTDSFTINVTSAENKRAKGDFTLWLTSATGKKTLTGTFDCQYD